MSVVIDGTSGITTPAETVQGALTTTGNTILGDATTDTLTVGVTGIVKDASGNVGIGTASPSKKLSIVGTTTGNAEIVGTAYSELYFVSTVGGSSNGALSYDIANNALRTYTAGVQQAAITSTGLFQFNSGYGSVATAYGCRAWVNFNGTGTVAIRASGNVSSITDNGTGDYTVNFTTAMPDANYSTSVDANLPQSEYSVLAAGSVRIFTSGSSGTLIDPSIASVSIFR